MTLGKPLDPHLAKGQCKKKRKKGRGEKESREKVRSREGQVDLKGIEQIEHNYSLILIDLRAEF